MKRRLPTSSITESLSRAQDLLKRARHAVALTGAGVSTPSGIPDFRSPESGLWLQVNPFEVASLRAFCRHPEVFYDWIRPMVRLVLEALPNPAHVALAELEQMGMLQTTITQNIDGLHLRAGSSRVVEIHGHFRTATCIRCYQRTPGEQVLDHLQGSTGVPACQQCGGVLKPDIILMGEQLPFAEVQASYQEARRCDLMLIAGSSLTVEPAASLPELARQSGASLILVNLEPTWVDPVAEIVIHADVAQVLPELVNGLRQMS
jgi:NAD-dependent deacetylase